MHPILPNTDLPSLPAAPRTWRLGTTSYVYPDDILPNVARLVGHTEDIEVILFESADVSNLPSPDTVARMAALAEGRGLTWTIHFPIDRSLADADPAIRLSAVRQALHIAELTRPLAPYAYIVHPDAITPDATAARVAAWQRDFADSVARLLDGGIAPRLLAVENLRPPFAWAAPVIERFDLSVCLDTGHLWLQGADAAAHFRRWAPRVRVIHLHGERDARDHLSLAATDAVRLRAFLGELSAYAHVVSLEVFSFEDTASSIGTLNELLSPADLKRPDAIQAPSPLHP
jgi:sugar phosphate isomerase/epimerase